MSELKDFKSLLEYYRYHKARNGLTQDQLRRRWGLKRQSHVHALLYGKCQPRPRLARTICEDTGLDLFTVFSLDKPVKHKQREFAAADDRSASATGRV